MMKLLFFRFFGNFYNFLNVCILNTFEIFSVNGAWCGNPRSPLQMDKKVFQHCLWNNTAFLHGREYSLYHLLDPHIYLLFPIKLFYPGLHSILLINLFGIPTTLS